MECRVGVLGLQGDFSLHKRHLERLGVEVPIVRSLETLATCDGLILPGGESTTFLKLLKKTDLFGAIQTFARDHGVFGTCAGMIMMALHVVNDPMETLGLIDMTVERNAYGRQVDSFIDRVRIPLLNKQDFEGVFIRAPKIRKISEDTEAIGFHGDEVVMARNGRVLVTAFHPELTNDLIIHEFFVKSFVAKG